MQLSNHIQRAVISAAIFIALAVSTSAAPIDYARDVRPILQTHCYECHGADDQKSAYRLDNRDIALRGGDSGEPAIIPHNAKDSPLIRYISSEDEDSRMPPKDSGQPRLTPAEIRTLRTWIDEGPAWPTEHADDIAKPEPLWSLAPLIKPPLPSGQLRPIDAFIRAKLATKSLAPAPQADRRALIRRLSYDLTGLAPAPDEVSAFLVDTAPDAYDRLVDRMLASPRYGEHWARHWLDVANYADTHGNDHDYARPNAWHYRDYVIRSLNGDKPYARFVQEQIAGDKLFPDDPQATVALGFLAAGPWDHTLMVTVRADTVDHRSAQNLDRDSMVSAAMGAFQSLTVHCARCHNHKFDPISQREYYSLQAVFAGVDRADRPFDTDARVYAHRKRLLAENAAIEKRDTTILATIDSPAISQRVATWEADRLRREKSWTDLEVISAISTGGATLARQSDGSWLATGTRPVQDTYIITAQRRAGKLAAIRLEAIADERLPERGPGRWDNGNFHLSEFRAFAAPKSETVGATPINFSGAISDYDEGPTISAAQSLDNDEKTVWGIHPRYGQSHTIVYNVKQPVDHPDKTTFTFVLEFRDKAAGHGIGRFRLTTSDEPATSATSEPLAPSVITILNTPAQGRTPDQRRELAFAVLKAENAAALAALPTPQMVYAATHDFTPDGANFTPSTEPRPIFVLARGDLARPGEPVGPGTLSCVPAMPPTLDIPNMGDEAARRAALAKWLSDERNVLTWRSITNRVWSYHFGRGLCDTPNDFGRMGTPPSHAELLDWLALWFRDDVRGSLKSLHRMIVTSETWKQSSITAQGMQIDADNRLLWRQNRQRLSGEQIRDTLLCTSGKLDLTMGGPAAVQFNSRGDATFNPGGNPAFLDYEHFDPDAPDARRRAIYRFLFRTVPDPLMDALDVPDGGATTPVRTASTTAVQAFAMLNNNFVIRQSQHIADRIAHDSPQPDRQADTAYLLILQRTATDHERNALAPYISRYGLANACQLLLNSNEFHYLD